MMKKKILFILYDLTWNQVPLFVELSKSYKFDIEFLFLGKTPAQSYDYDADKLQQYLLKHLQEENVCFKFKYGLEALKYLSTYDYNYLIAGIRVKHLLGLLLSTNIWRKNIVYNSWDRLERKWIFIETLIMKFMAYILKFGTTNAIYAGKRHIKYLRRWGFMDGNIKTISMCSEIWMFSEEFDLKHYFKNTKTFKIGFSGRCENKRHQILKKSIFNIR